jgi:hypothetical protein
MTCPAIKPPDTFAEAVVALQVLRTNDIFNSSVYNDMAGGIYKELHDLKAALVLANKRIEHLSQCANEFRFHGTIERCFGCHKYAPVLGYSTDGAVVCSRECFALVKRSKDPAWIDAPGPIGATGPGV